MKFDPNIHHRRSIRLREFDYAQAGMYFITICTWHREPTLGVAENGKITLSDAGLIIQSVWNGLSARFSGVGLDAFIIMPNHIHGIICVEATLLAPDAEMGAINRAPTLGRIVRAFKGTSTYLVHRSGFAGFAWQRNYYEHIISNEASLHTIRRYIQANPAMWACDVDNLDGAGLNVEAVHQAMAEHYGFTGEELDFIINYDIKYRMGRDAEEGGKMR